MKVCTLTELIYFGPILDQKVAEELSTIGIHLIFDCSTKKERQNFSKQNLAAFEKAEKNGISVSNVAINKNQKRKNVEMIAIIKQLASWPANNRKVYICCTEGRNRSAFVAGLLCSFSYCLRYEIVFQELKKNYEKVNGALKKPLIDREFNDQFQDLVNVTELNDKLYRIDISDCCKSQDELEITANVVEKMIDFIFNKTDDERNRIILKLQRLGLHLLAINEDKYLQWGWNIVKLHVNAWIQNSHPSQLEYRKNLSIQEQSIDEKNQT